MIELRKGLKYKVKFTPLAGFGVYGDEIDVSDKVDVSGIKNIRRSIDAGDFQIGVFTTDDITIQAFNFNGYFNENDSRSIFMTGRDKTKVVVEFIEFDDDGEETSNISFRGIINEEATKFNLKTEVINFRVLSSDSIIRKTKIPSGTVANGSSFETAIENILNIADITSILTVSNANINVDYNGTVGDGSDFDNQNAKDKLNELLAASNSVLTIDNDVVTVRSRDETETTQILRLFGPNDLLGRENIIDITKYNTGLHRMFTSITVNGQIRSNSSYEAQFGSKEKKFNFDFVTDPLVDIAIADRIVDEFKTPKIELNVRVRTSVAKSVKLLDRVQVNYPLRYKPSNDFLPVYGLSKYGTDKYPFTFGSTKIDSNVGFKIIEIEENPNSFTTILKLRQIGKDIGDGFFTERGPALYGFATYGEDIYFDSGHDVTYSSSYGSAQYSGNGSTYGG